MYINLQYTKIVFKVYFKSQKVYKLRQQNELVSFWEKVMGGLHLAPIWVIQGLGCRSHLFVTFQQVMELTSRLVARYFWKPVRKSWEKAIRSGDKVLFPKPQGEKIKGAGGRLCIRAKHQGQIPKVSASCLPKVIILYSKVSQPQHYRHLGPDNSLLWGDVLCITGCLVASLVSTYWMPAAHHSP